MDLRSLRYFAAVAEERHFGRAAVRLSMTQPPLSRAVRQLETELGVLLFHRSPSGVTLTAAGATLHHDARALLAQAEAVRTHVTAAAGGATLRLGILADIADPAGTTLATQFRSRHPGVRITVQEGELAEPACGLKTGHVDVALTRMPFNTSSLRFRTLRSDPVGVVVRIGDPLARRVAVSVNDLGDRRWFQLPDGTDPLWRTYWNGGQPAPSTRRSLEGPVVRTVGECLQSVLWAGTVGLGPLGQALPPGLTMVPVRDLPPSRLVIAWRKADHDQLTASFVRAAVATFHRRRANVDETSSVAAR